MATQGSPWICETSKITEQLKKSKGRITHAAKSLNVCYQTLKDRIDSESELKDLLPKLRNEFEENILDAAENTVGFAMSKGDADLSNALKAALYTLNSRGKVRGWNNTFVGDSNAISEKLDAVMNQMSKAQNQASGVSDGSISLSDLMKD